MANNYRNLISFLWVKDMNRAKIFYRQTLGLNIVLESEGWVELSIPGTGNAFLALNQWKGEGTPPVNKFITLGVETLETFHGRLMADDVHMKGGIQEFPDQGMRMFKFFDPDGNILTAAAVE